MPELPPWLTPPDFIGAMRSGASLGLQARGQDRADEAQAFEEQSSADRLKLAYDQLAKQERVASMQAMQKLQLGEAANALRAAHEQALGEHYKEMQAKAQKMIEVQTASEQLRAAQANRHFNTDGTVTEYDPAQGTAEIIGTPKEKPTPPGTLEYDKEGNIIGARGAPGSASAKLIKENAATKKAVEDLPKAGFHRPAFLGGKPPKLTVEQARQFKAAAKGDKEKARQLARDAGFDF
jgi:hypothetical protein